ncbi:hypothetical protein BH10PSE18_BH10PSE18_23870 [soil metagenome]
MKNPSRIADLLALPPGSHSERYDVYRRICINPTEVIESTVAPASLDGKAYAQGGAQQLLITDFSDFSPPERWQPPGGWR